MAYSYNSYNNNKDANKPFDPVTYSAYRLNNGESTVDKTCLTMTMWKQMLKISIFPRKENTEEMVFDMDAGITVYLSHSKAKIFANELRNFLRDPSLYNGAGVPSGQGIITISNGSEFGSSNPVVCIRKLDETGNVTSMIAYEFKTDFYYAIRGYSGTKEFTKDSETYRNLEIEEMILMLDEYCKAMTYAVAHTVRDNMRYDIDRVKNSLYAISEKLGVETNRPSNRGSGYNSSTSFFNNAGSNGYSGGNDYTPATLDDID